MGPKWGRELFGACFAVVAYLSWRFFFIISVVLSIAIYYVSRPQLDFPERH